MKALKHIPSIKQLSFAYSTLQHKKTKILDQKLALYSQWVRLDPRLGEIIIQHIAQCWSQYNPVTLHKQICRQAWPAVFCVLLEQVPFYFKQKNLKANLSLFQKWAECIKDSIDPAPNELFFISLYPLGSKSLMESATHATQIYKKWGYFEKELLINKAVPPKKTLILAKQRRLILNELLKRKRKITVKEYLSELNFQVHIKQAQRDLKTHPFLKAYGQTRARIYIYKQSK